MWHSSSTTQNQWLINPAELQMLQNTNVDWAALAQKWVEMKHVNSPEGPNLASQNNDKITTEPPSVDKVTDDLIEGGEAPMDMETKDDEAVEPLNETNRNWNNYHSTWPSQWSWNMPGGASTAPLQHLNQGAATPISGNIIDPLSMHASNVGAAVPVITTPTESVITNSSVQVPGSFNYNSLSGGIPPLLPTKPDHWHPNANLKINRVPINQKHVPEQYPIIDSSKMKRLPAWIREGLSKMEQEKQKKMQKEKQKTEYTSSELSHGNDDTFIKNQISMYDKELSENEDEQQVDEEKISHHGGILSSYSSRSPSPLLERNVDYTSFHRNPSPVTEMPTKAIRKTKDEIMEESMLEVRRVLTSLLLEVTEKIVVFIAKDEVEKWKSAPLRRIQKSKVLTVSKNANLGLAAYGSDSSESESEDEKSEDNEDDSDADLRALIEKKQRDFLLVAESIDEEIENQEVRERQVMDDEENEEEENNEVKTGSTNSVEKDYSDSATKNKENSSSVEGKINDEKIDINNENLEKEKLGSKTKSKLSSSTSSKSRSSSSSSSKTSSRDSSLDRKNCRSNHRDYSKTHRRNLSRSPPSKSRRGDKRKESSRLSRSRSRSKRRSRSRRRGESRSRYSRRTESKSRSSHRNRDYKDRDERRSHRRSNSRRRHDDSTPSRRDSKRFVNSSSSNRYESRRKRSSSRDSKYSNRKRR